MRKSAFILLIWFSFACQLKAHVSLTNPEGGETFQPGETVDVSWVVVQSHNTLNWDLLYTEDGGYSWDTIKADIRVETLSYQWMVPAISTMQARIKVVQDNVNADYESTSPNFTIGGTTGIHDPHDLIQIKISPNPFMDYTTIAFENPRHLNHTLTIFNTQGGIVRSIPNITTGRVKVERKDLTAGLYFIRLRDENEIRAIGKLAIQ